MVTAIDRRKGITAAWLLRLSLYQGVYARVARQLGVHPSMVCRVAAGTKTSRRVRAALERELRRIERLTARVA